MRKLTPRATTTHELQQQKVKKKKNVLENPKKRTKRRSGSAHVRPLGSPGTHTRVEPDPDRAARRLFAQPAQLTQRAGVDTHALPQQLRRVRGKLLSATGGRTGRRSGHKKGKVDQKKRYTNKAKKTKQKNKPKKGTLCFFFFRPGKLFFKIRTEYFNRFFPLFF